jgi:hypothetical protein
MFEGLFQPFHLLIILFIAVLSTACLFLRATSRVVMWKGRNCGPNLGWTLTKILAGENRHLTHNRLNQC